MGMSGSVRQTSLSWEAIGRKSLFCWAMLNLPINMFFVLHEALMCFILWTNRYPWMIIMLSEIKISYIQCVWTIAVSVQLSLLCRTHLDAQLTEAYLSISLHLSNLLIWIWWNIVACAGVHVEQSYRQWRHSLGAAWQPMQRTRKGSHSVFPGISGSDAL